MSLFKALFLLFLIVPLVEIYILIKVGSVIGAFPTVFLVVFTAVLGVFLLRMQGFSTLRRGQSALMRGEIPAIEMLEGMLLVIAGVLLLTPGFFTDTLGFLILIPPIRRAFIHWLLDHINIIRPGGHGRGPTARRDFIEGDFRRDDERPR